MWRRLWHGVGEEAAWWCWAHLGEVGEGECDGRGLAGGGAHAAVADEEGGEVGEVDGEELRVERRCGWKVKRVVNRGRCRTSVICSSHDGKPGSPRKLIEQST